MQRLPPRYYRLHGFYSQIYEFICGMGVVAVDIALVALNLHFLSDVVAGSFVGGWVGLFSVAVCRASELGMRLVKTDIVASE